MNPTTDVQLLIELGDGDHLARADVSVYAVTSGAPALVEQRVIEQPRLTVNLSGREEELFYAVVDVRALHRGESEHRLGKRRVQWLALFERSDPLVSLSERQTVATVYCCAGFLRLVGDEVVLSDPQRALHLALGMKRNFIAAGGKISKVIQSSPNGLESNSYALFNFLGNLAYYTLTDDGVYDRLLSLTGADSLLTSLLTLARRPFTEVAAIYGLIGDREQIFEPSLPSLKKPASPVPHQWTLTLKFNDSGAENFMIAGIGYAVFDANDRLWLANNVRQGTPNSSTYCVVLEPDGSPAPFSPLFGGGLLGAGFGVAVDRKGETIAYGNFGWGPMEQNPQHGSISLFSHRGEALSPSEGYTRGLSRVQGLEYDCHGNLWITSWGTQDPMPPTASRYDFKGRSSGVAVYLDGDPEQVLVHEFGNPHHLTFDLVTDAEGSCYVSNAGDKEHGIRSSVRKLRIEGDRLKEVARWESEYISPHAKEKGPEHRGFETFRQITLGPKGDVFLVAVVSNRVIQLNRDLEFQRDFTVNLHGPWGITFDPAGTMFVSNFTQAWDEREETLKLRNGPFGVTVIRDQDENTAELMTVPTGGEEVTLANGLPLYGNNAQGPKGHDLPLACFDPIMRLTGSRVDRAGNLWSCNNWKPSADIDLLKGNPGGDGMVVFVGVAEPDPNPR